MKMIYDDKHKSIENVIWKKEMFWVQDFTTLVQIVIYIKFAEICQRPLNRKSCFLDIFEFVLKKT